MLDWKFRKSFAEESLWINIDDSRKSSIKGSCSMFGIYVFHFEKALNLNIIKNAPWKISVVKKQHAAYYSWRTNALKGKWALCFISADSLSLVKMMKLDLSQRNHFHYIYSTFFAAFKWFSSLPSQKPRPQVSCLFRRSS